MSQQAELPAPEDCGTYEALLAARTEGTLGAQAAELLQQHLAICAACRDVADTLAPLADATGDFASLPVVDPESYALGLEVARGGMGRILAARDLRIGRSVAVKELLKRSPGLAARFEREARVTARLQHPGIVPIYEIGRWPDGTPFYAMRMVEGRTLREAIARSATLAARLALLPAVIAATEAIAFAHAQRVIHRDLTPSNVLVGAYGETVVIDWGLAKDLADASDIDELRHREPSEGLTNLGAVIGTLAYMPPEQANAEPVDESADVYALGAMLYHLLGGRAPYAGAEDLHEAVKAGPPRPIADIVPAAPPDLVSIVEKAMARDPARRYPSARELADELTRFQAGRMVEAHAYTTGERMRRFVHRNRAAVLITAVAVLTLGGGGALSIRRILRERRAATDTITNLIEEKGRTELLAGNPLRALAFLVAAFERGDASPGELFMLARALREVDTIEATLDCGSDARFIDISPDGLHFAVACRDVARIGSLTTRKWEITLGPIADGFDEIRYSHDGHRLISQGADGYLRIFDTSHGAKLVEMLHAPNTRITRANWTPDDQQIVSTGFDGTAQVWDVKTGKRLRTMLAGQGGLVGVHGALTPDGKTLITVTLGGRATGWNVATGEKLGELDHGGQILGGDLSPDGTMGCTPGVDRRVKVWDIRERALRFTLSGHSDAVWKCVFSPDSSRLVTASNDGTAKVWDLASGAMIASVNAGELVWWVTWSPDGREIATNSLGGALKVWEAESGALLSSHDDPFGGKTSRFSRDGKLLITLRADGRVRIWNEPDGPLQRETPIAVVPSAVSPDGTRAVLATGFAGPEIWDVVVGARVTHESLAEPIAMSGDGKYLAGRTTEGIAVLETLTGRTVARVALADVTALAFDEGGQRLVAIDRGVARSWDRGSATAGTILGPATIVAMSRSGRRAIIATHATNEVDAASIVDTSSGATLTALDVTGAVVPVGFSDDETRIVLQDGPADARRLTIFDDTGTIVARERVENDGAQLDPAARLVTVAGPDSIIKVLRLSDGAPTSQFIGEHLGRMQVDRSGQLIAAIDRMGANLLVLQASDGVVIGRHEILHSAPSPGESDVTLPSAMAWWTGDGAARAIVSVSGAVAVWDAANETRSPAEVSQRVKKHLPWRIVEGQLEPTIAEIDGNVTADGEVPTATVTIIAGIRDIPRLPSHISWAMGANLTRARLYQKVLQTVDDGRFQLAQIVPGEYSLIARSPELGRVSAPLDVHVADPDQGRIELVLDRAIAITGRITNADGVPLAGAQLTATCRSHPIDAATTTSRSDGSFTFELLAGDCNYDLQGVTPEGTVQERFTVDGHAGRYTAPALVLVKTP
jgi:WD40 repeat protein